MCNAIRSGSDVTGPVECYWAATLEHKYNEAELKNGQTAFTSEEKSESDSDGDSVEKNVGREGLVRCKCGHCDEMPTAQERMFSPGLGFTRG